MSEVAKERKKKGKKSEGVSSADAVPQKSKATSNGDKEVHADPGEVCMEMIEMPEAEKPKESKTKNGLTQKVKIARSASANSLHADHEPETKPAKVKQKKDKGADREAAAAGENDAAHGYTGRIISKLAVWKRRKDGRIVDSTPSEISTTSTPHDSLATPRGGPNDKDEDEAIAKLLKDPNGHRSGPSATKSADMDAAAYLRAVVHSNSPNVVNPESALSSGPPAPMITRANQNVTLEDLKVLSSSAEPFSDSQALAHGNLSPQVPPKLSASTQIPPKLSASGQIPQTSTTALLADSRVRAPTLAAIDEEAAVLGISSDRFLREPSSSGSATQPSNDDTATTIAVEPANGAPKLEHVEQTSDLGHFFYSRLQGHSADRETISSGRKKEEARKNKKKIETKENERDMMKFNRDDGRYKYKGGVARIPIADEKIDSYEITKFSHNAWSGVRYYWVPDGEGKLSFITGERQYIGSWKKGVRHGDGEGAYDLDENEGIYTGEWKSGKPGGPGKLLTKRFRFDGGWKDGLRHGFGEYVKERLHYVGDWAYDKKHGYGIATYEDGTRYEGEWLEDARSGFGVCRYPDGSIYTGMWSENYRHGTGTSIYENGNRYVGEWYKDMKQGNGILYGALHQKLYDGKWWRNKRHGQGIGWFIETGDRYEGEWFLGKQHGEGDWYGADGSSYKGSYVDGFRQGTGLVIYASGDRYVGEWLRGIKEGTLCAYVYKDYGKFIGPFIADRANGQGEYHTFANRKIAGHFQMVVIEDEMGRYNGLTLNGKRFGRGTQTYTNGDFYDGEWRDGMRTGYGVMQYEDGGRYVGFWMKDQRSKLGTYSLPSGEKYIGRWLKDKRHGTGTMIFENKDRLVDAQWQDDAPLDGTGYFVYANKAVYRGPLKDGLPEGRGSLTLTITVLLAERAEYRKKIGIHYFLRGERKSRKEDQTGDDDLENAKQDEEEEEEDITAYVDSAKKNKRTKVVAIYQPNTVTFWREFKAGVIVDGPGVSVWDGNAYEGDFVGFERSGVGRMTRTTGESYFGEWKHDREWGLGEVRTRSQDLYVGYWYNGYRNGTGSQSYDDGGTFHGKWMNDRRHGIGVFVWPDRSMYHREYYKGELISKRQAEDSWARKQLAAWGVEKFPKRIEALPYAFSEWAKAGLPDWYGELVHSMRAPADDPSLDVFSCSTTEIPHLSH